MLIDAHTHAFSEKIAEKAVQQLIDYYQLPTSFGGQLTDLLEQAALAHLDALVLLVAATKPVQVKPAHDWILSRPWEGLANCPVIIPFGTYHIDDPHWLQEIDRLRAGGVRGIKLHPEFQGIDLSDPRLLPLLEEIAGEFVLMVHVGDPRVSQQNLSTPRKVAALLDLFPNLTVIAAHLGGYCFWQDAYDALAGRNLYLDTSSAIQFIDPDLLRRLVDKHGTEHILCGSDYPLDSPVKAMEAVDRLSWLSGEQKAAIMGGNCARLFGARTT
ncbi:MAG: amidohydrolase family protein [Armatimonadota bacterium]